jgi:IMP dehydrogenase
MHSDDRFSEGFSFDDVLIRPRRSNVLPSQVDLKTMFTRTVPLNIPLVSAGMDTVTEARLAIALAQDGGIGVVHKNLPIDEQAMEIDTVKRSQQGIITNPFTLHPEDPVQAAEDVMARYHVSGVPITDRDGKLVGILTNRDLRFQEDWSQPIGEVMTQEGLVTVPPGTTLDEAKVILHEHRIEKLPIVDDNGILLGLLTIKDIFKVRDFPNANRDAHGRLRVAAAVGVTAEELDRAKALAEAHVDALVIDTAHGHSQMVIDMVGKVKNALPDMDVVAGNIVTAEAARELIAAGADALKVGVGPGSICTTRVVSGAGMPQLTAVLDVVSVAAEHGVPVIADGGIRYSGDIVKALAAGAHSVMIGSLFAGTDEAPGETILYEGRTFKAYRGMGSIKAMQRGSKARYMQHDVAENRKLVPEGVEGRVPFRGLMSETVHQLMGGLRSGMGYAGCPNLEALRTDAEFIRVSAASVQESHPHDITITEEPPNYQMPR